jgi:DNA primase
MSADENEFFVDFSGGEGLASWPSAPGPVFDRFDRAAVDLAAVLDSLLGPGVTRKGQHGTWWRCPAHADRTPSLTLMPCGTRWRCWGGGCGEHGDAVDVIRRVIGCTFGEAKDWLQERGFVGRAASRPPSGESAGPASARPAAGRSKLTRGAAGRIVSRGRLVLFGKDDLAVRARRYLHEDRGLSDTTIRRAWLGVSAVRDYPPEVVIPWYSPSGVLIGLIARRLDPGPTETFRYRWIFRDNPVAYPSPAVVVPGLPLVVVEGEFDALLLGQELAGLAAVVTTGSAAGPPGPALLEAAAVAPAIYLAHDDDPAGHAAAARWPGGIRVRPPSGKDWTEFHIRRHDLQGFWRGIVER